MRQCCGPAPALPKLGAKLANFGAGPQQDQQVQHCASTAPVLRTCASTAPFAYHMVDYDKQLDLLILRQHCASIADLRQHWRRSNTASTAPVGPPHLLYITSLHGFRQGETLPTISYTRPLPVPCLCNRGLCAIVLLVPTGIIGQTGQISR